MCFLSMGILNGCCEQVRNSEIIQRDWDERQFSETVVLYMHKFTDIINKFGELVSVFESFNPYRLIFFSDQSSQNRIQNLTEQLRTMEQTLKTMENSVDSK